MNSSPPWAEPRLLPLPQSASTPAARAARRRRRWSSLAARYLGYVGYFVGAGLISGAVVHHPLDPAHYTRIALYVNEFILTRERPARPRALTVIGTTSSTTTACRTGPCWASSTP
ncbi:hypothetical protein [Streptomyces sp. ISL-94]|uniref:hypothetical protein n=1 Tax=Streptomyces sp. ISL-94 TaxID=2819190 RepID=UPI001BECA8C6|nr:hypothetical protein [Streptomyces sp. ISL-94]MBT2480086.1 hypothetical protein [Streptomyces sp. ISL-94]